MTSDRRVSKLIVVKVTTPKSPGQIFYVSAINFGPPRLTANPVEAQDLSHMPVIDRMDFLVRCENGFAREKKRYEVSLVHTTLDITDVAVDMDDGEVKETLQSMALSKLTRSQIDALGATDILVYHKLKFHEEEESDDNDIHF